MSKHGFLWQIMTKSCSLKITKSLILKQKVGRESLPRVALWVRQDLLALLALWVDHSCNQEPSLKIAALS
jgi:hypothetical protein